MLFSSYVFIFAFLPITLLVFYLLAQWVHARAATVWLTIASLFYYGWWDVDYVPLILGSCVVNFIAGRLIDKAKSRQRKAFLVIGLIFNLGLLSYFKYTHFALDTLNTLFGADYSIATILLPLAISFFTFQQGVHNKFFPFLVMRHFFCSSMGQSGYCRGLF